MPNITKPKRVKPSKPHPDFPLTPHPSGRWCKKIHGQIRYFGPWEDPKGALERWLDQKDDLLADRPIRAVRGLTCRELANYFLTAKQSLVEAGELTRHHFVELKRACGRALDCFGKTTPVVSLHPEDFDRLRTQIAKIYGAVGLGNEIQRIRSLFKYGVDAALLDKPVGFGPSFKKPSKKTRRLARVASGPRMFQAAELRKIISKADGQLKAMILVGINCALGQHDIATLPLAAIDLKRGWHNHARPKTGTPRCAPLWPETVTALKAVLSVRAEAIDSEDAGLVFLTKFKRRWVRCLPSGTWVDSIGLEFRKLLKEKKIKTGTRAFYSLRRTFRTVADECGDQPAIIHVMGHAPDDNDMSAVYRQTIGDKRLRKVTDYVHRWLFPPKKRKAK